MGIVGTATGDEDKQASEGITSEDGTIYYLRVTSPRFHPDGHELTGPYQSSTALGAHIRVKFGRECQRGQEALDKVVAQVRLGKVDHLTSPINGNRKRIRTCHILREVNPKVKAQLPNPIYYVVSSRIDANPMLLHMMPDADVEHWYDKELHGTFLDQDAAIAKGRRVAAKRASEYDGGMPSEETELNPSPEFAQIFFAYRPPLYMSDLTSIQVRRAKSVEGSEGSSSMDNDDGVIYYMQTLTDRVEEASISGPIETLEAVAHEMRHLFLAECPRALQTIDHLLAQGRLGTVGSVSSYPLGDDTSNAKTCEIIKEHNPRVKALLPGPAWFVVSGDANYNQRVEVERSEVHGTFSSKAEAVVGARAVGQRKAEEQGDGRVDDVTEKSGDPTGLGSIQRLMTYGPRKLKDRISMVDVLYADAYKARHPDV